MKSTLQRILDAINPELKPANQAMQKVIKRNLVSSAIYHTELEKLDKAIKANDVAKAAEQAGKLVSLANKAGKDIEQDIADAKEKLAKATTGVSGAKVSLKNAESNEKAVVAALKACEGIKTAAHAKKIERMAEGLRAFGDFVTRARKIGELIQKKQDPAKQVEMLKSALQKAGLKAKKETAKSKADLAKFQNALTIAKDLVKLYDKKFSAYQSERIALGDLVKVLRGIAPDANGVKRPLHEGVKGKEGVQTLEKTEKKRTTASFIHGKTGKIGYGSYLSIDGNKITVEHKNGSPWPYILDKGIWMEKPVIGSDQYIPEGDPRFKAKGGVAYIVWGKRKKSLEE